MIRSDHEYTQRIKPTAKLSAGKSPRVSYRLMNVIPGGFPGMNTRIHMKNHIRAHRAQAQTQSHNHLRSFSHLNTIKRTTICVG